MTEVTDARGPGTSPVLSARRSVGVCVLTSAGCLAVQASVTDYGPQLAGAGGFWFALGCLLLWRVYRGRSRTARGFVIVASLVGVVLYGMAALRDGHALLVAAAFLGQALPLMADPVRHHVQIAGRYRRPRRARR